MDASLIISGGALVVAALTLLNGYFQLSRTAKKDSEDELSDELERMRKDRDDARRERDEALEHVRQCERERQLLQRQNMRLLHELEQDGRQYDR